MGGEDGFYPPNDNNTTSSDMINDEISSHSAATSEIVSVKDENTVEDFDSNLPKTVTLLHGPNGSKLYLVGTAHFSLESQEDVSKVIRTVKPHIVVVELCRARSSILLLDEKTIEREVADMSFKRMREIIKENGFLQGMVNILIFNVSAQLTRDLGVSPGGEFRRAFQEVKQLSNCMLHYGDRPIHITLNRALSVLSWWQRIRLVFMLLFENSKFTKEDVEQFKEADLLASLLKNLSSDFPEIGKVFIEERDIYLTFSLQMAVESAFYNLNNQKEPTIAVGVVGIGHTPGIIKLWGKVKDEDVPPILVIEERKKGHGIFKKSLAVGIMIFIGYKVGKRINFTTTYNNILSWLK